MRIANPYNMLCWIADPAQRKQQQIGWGGMTEFAIR